MNQSKQEAGLQMVMTRMQAVLKTYKKNQTKLQQTCDAQATEIDRLRALCISNGIPFKADTVSNGEKIPELAEESGG